MVYSTPPPPPLCIMNSIAKMTGKKIRVYKPSTGFAQVVKNLGLGCWRFVANKAFRITQNAFFQGIMLQSLFKSCFYMIRQLKIPSITMHASLLQSAANKTDVEFFLIPVQLIIFVESSDVMILFYRLQQLFAGILRYHAVLKQSRSLGINAGDYHTLYDKLKYAQIP